MTSQRIVWAPFAHTVDLATWPSGWTPGAPPSIEPLCKGSGGWWIGEAPAPGSDYAFLVDGEGPFPDPRSPWQPHGVHSPSRTFDTRAFAWSDGAFAGVDARGAVHYELHVGTFTPEGTLDAAAADLARLARIGVTMVELMPLAAFPGERGWGYDGVAPFAVHDAYGGPAALQRFVDAAHGHGIGVCLDVVFNHLGPDGNYLARFGPYFTDRYETPWGWAVNLDSELSEGMRGLIVDACLRWFDEFHVDALRLDAVHELHDHSPLHILAELSSRTAALRESVGRPLSLIAESDRNDPRTVTKRSRGGLGLTAQWADDVHHALHAYLTGERHGYYCDFGSIDTLNKAFTSVFVHDGSFSTFRGTTWGAPVDPTTERNRFVVFASNHDQVGNRALGDRPAAALSSGASAAALALVLLGPFTPMLFMGEEFGATTPFQYFTDHEPQLGAAVTKGRTDEFARHGWEALYGEGFHVPDPQAPSTFAASRIDRSAANPAIAEWFDAVMSLRGHTLRDGAWLLQPVAVTERAPRQLTMTGPVTVHANLSDEDVRYEGHYNAVFGRATIDCDGFVLHPDSVALCVTTHRDDAHGVRT